MKIELRHPRTVLEEKGWNADAKPGGTTIGGPIGRPLVARYYSDRSPFFFDPKYPYLFHPTEKGFEKLNALVDELYHFVVDDGELKDPRQAYKVMARLVNQLHFIQENPTYFFYEFSKRKMWERFFAFRGSDKFRALHDYCNYTTTRWLWHFSRISKLLYLWTEVTTEEVEKMFEVERIVEEYVALKNDGFKDMSIDDIQKAVDILNTARDSSLDFPKMGRYARTYNNIISSIREAENLVIPDSALDEETQEKLWTALSVTRCTLVRLEYNFRGANYPMAIYFNHPIYRKRRKITANRTLTSFHFDFCVDHANHTLTNALLVHFTQEGIRGEKL